MTTELAPRPLSSETALTSPEGYVADHKKWSALIKSGALPKHVKSPEMAIAITRIGEAYGWDAMRSLSAIYVVDGRPCLSSESMLGLVREKMPRATVHPEAMTAECCTIKARRSPEDDWATFTFTIDDARAAGLVGKANWKGYPGDMLWARCASRVCRRLFSDVIQGAYTLEEMERPRLHVAQVIPESLQPPAEPTELDEIHDAIEGDRT